MVGRKQFHTEQFRSLTILLFGPDGIIYFATLNALGHLRDSITASHLIEVIGIFKIRYDQGFPTTGNLFD